MPHITSFADAERALEPYWPGKLQRHLQTLEHIERFMDFLGSPQDKLKMVHVAGTSGKTSTAYYIAALLAASGKKVGLTVSPHVDQLNERVQINLTPLPEEAFCEGLEQFLGLVKKSGVALNYFEIMYTFAFWYFVRAGVDYAVVEVGMGGLLDSTNVSTRADKVCVITDIGLDHLNILGSTLPEITMHKAGIIQLHNAVFCYKQGEVIMDVIRQAARKKQADLHTLNAHAAQTQLAFLPAFQQRNLGLARAAADWVLQRDTGAELEDAAVLHAARIRIPGRMEIFERDGKTVIVDAAHNAQKLHTLAQSVHAGFASQPVAALVSLAAGRDYRLDEAAKEMAGLGTHLIITTFGGPKDGPHVSIEPQSLQAACTKYGARSVEIIVDPAKALQALVQRPEPVLVVAGSFYLLNHIRPLLV